MLKFRAGPQEAACHRQKAARLQSGRVETFLVMCGCVPVNLEYPCPTQPGRTP